MKEILKDFVMKIISLEIKCYAGMKIKRWPSESDWANARRLCTFFEYFYELTLRVSDFLYATSNNFLH